VYRALAIPAIRRGAINSHAVAFLYMASSVLLQAAKYVIQSKEQTAGSAN
jgi:hypothetical protein